MLGSSERASAEGAGLEIPSRIENAQAPVLHQWALWPTKTLPHPPFPFSLHFPFPCCLATQQGLCCRLATVSLEHRAEVGGCALMKSEQGSIFGKLRRQIAQPPDSPFQRPLCPAVSQTASPSNPVSFLHMGQRHASAGQPRPHFGPVTQL